MSFLFHKHPNTTFAALLDIGSGSVLVSVIASNPQQKNPKIIWSHREYTPLKQNHTQTDSAKNILTSLVGAFLLLESKGKSALRSEYPHAHITNLFVAICAPWSYTTTKTIKYTQEKPFEITEELLTDLLETAHKKVIDELKLHEQVSAYGLSVIDHTTIAVLANDYPIRIGNNQEATSATIIETSAVAQASLVDAISSNKEKMLARANLRLNSFMTPYFFVTKEIAHQKNLKDYLLVDITFEATEIGIVRDNALLYCTHAPTGVFTIARSIAETLGIPAAEAYGYLHSDEFTHYMESYSDEKQAAVKKILQEYTTTLQQLFLETGDSLVVPRNIFVHSDAKTEKFFSDQLKEAATAISGTAHAVHSVSQEVLTADYTEAERTHIIAHDDSALLIAAHFFHTHHSQESLSVT